MDRPRGGMAVEYLDMVNQIVAAEHSAKALAEEGRQRQEQLRSGLEREAADLREEYMQRARHRVELVEQTERAGAEETIAQLDFIRSMHCDLAQGYYFDRPISVEEFEAKYLPLPPSDLA